MKRNPFFILAGMILGLVLSACGPSPTYTLYVATSGNDSSACTSESMPCLTLAGALGKARNLHTSLTEAGDGVPPNVTYVINVAAGTYLVEGDGGARYRVEDGAGEIFALLDFNVNILGAGIDATIFDADGFAGGILAEGDAEIILRDFTIQNVASARDRLAGDLLTEGCIHLRGSAQGLIESIKLDNCLEAGFVNKSDMAADNPIELVDVIISNTGTLGPGFGQSGHGVVNSGALSATNTTISGSRGHGVLSSEYLVLNGGLVELNGQNGLLLSGEAHLLDTTIRRNGQDGCIGACADASPAGVGIQNPGFITLTGVNISRNLFGIKIDHPDANVLLESSTVEINQLAGIFVQEGTFTAQQSAINDNATLFLEAGSRYRGPGGIYVALNGSASLRESTIDGNLNGGIVNGGALNLLDTSVSENTGDAPALRNGGSASLENTLLANNRQTEESVFNGAIINSGLLELLNVTLSNNRGFGLQNQSGNATIAYTTFAFHTYGLVLESGASTTIKNSLIAANLGPNCLGGGVSELIDIGFNLSTNELGFSSCGFSTPFYVVDELLLDELADNGGFTMTHALLEGSPAIDAAFGDCPIGDQRNLPRPFGAACDVGAYETSALAALSGTFPTPTVDVPFITVLIDSGCFYGPGLDWPRYSNLSAGTQAEIVGQGFGGGWMVVKHPTIANANCWIDIDDVQFDIPLDQLRLISIPPKPTQAPTATKDPREPTVCPTDPQQPPGTCQ